MASATVSADNASMREDPSDDAALVVALAKGIAVDILGESDDGTWFIVSGVVEGSTRIGWVRAKFLSVGGAPLGGDTAGAKDKPASQDKPGPVVAPPDATPVGNPEPFATNPSNS